MSTYETTETEGKQCGIHVRPVCGAVFLPQRYTKLGEEDLEHAHNLVCSLRTQHDSKVKTKIAH